MCLVNGECQNDICSKNIHSGTKHIWHLMLPLMSSELCASLRIRCQMGHDVPAYCWVVWSFKDTCRFPLQENLQNFYTLKVAERAKEDKWKQGLLESLKNTSVYYICAQIHFLFVSETLHEVEKKNNLALGLANARVDNFATFMCRLSENPGSLNFLEPSGPI
jgi:hypothetical protein